MSNPLNIGKCGGCETPIFKKVGLKTVPNEGSVAVLIGPEGGFSEKERQTILALPRVIRLSLGPRIMRADTAAVAALTLVQAVCGDLA